MSAGSAKLAATFAAVVSVLSAGAALAAPPCDAPANAIVAENCLPGNPASQWDVDGAGDASIQGFATDISVSPGQAIAFKVDTPAANYRIDIYRLGYYGGLGARLVAVAQPSAALPQNQPDCLSDPTTGLVDCGNWAVSASWAVPMAATSGVYLAKLVREDPEDGRASHIVFVVRDDNGTSDLLVQTSDTTWQAYNTYGGNSLYTGAPDGRAYKVSYNRPFSTRCCDFPSGSMQSWLFNAEYPMLRWLERNGYDVSYTTGLDAERRGDEILEHAVYLSVGHDEYWSAGQRAAIEAARDAGVHLAFFSGNEGFWKTRWEPSIDASGTVNRTLVCYKETHANAKIDPLPGVWTGTWRDPRFGPHDGGRPENELNGTIFTVNGVRDDTLEVPAADGKMRFWRNTSIATLAPGQVAALPTGTLGYEWDEDLDNGVRPLGLIRMSSTTVDGVPHLQDYGSNYASGTATHHLTLYRHAGGGLVFGGGTVQWSWGLDDEHDFAGAPTDARMQQATVNLFADMGVQPGWLQAGLIPASASGDAIPPSTTITAPSNGASVTEGEPVNISGTAVDAGGGVVGGVEISVDGGNTWHPASGRAIWNYTWVPTAGGTATILVRAIDDSANRATTSSSITVTVQGPDQGPGGPIAVIASAANPFGRYYAEILRAEGLNAFAVEDISALTPASLAAYDVAILGEMALSAAQVSMLTNWVNAGGNLIAMRPDPQLAGLLGLNDLPTTLADAYLLVNTASAPGTGIVSQTIQFHGTADRYSLNGATTLATLYSTASTATANPAVTLRSVGANGGQAASFTYDLARSVVYTRQGNPAWAEQERDGTPPIRSDDLFFPTWINFNKVAIPQADEQQRLLANLILHMTLDRAPLPRFWYFPRDERAVVVMTGDDHASGGTAGRFNGHIAQSPPGCSVADWDCVRATSYVFPGTPIDDAEAEAFRQAGFEISVHVNTGCADWTPAVLDDLFGNQISDLLAQLPSIAPITTQRIHCVTWSDWFSVPTVSLGHGVRLDTTYYYWPPTWIQDRPGMFTGSGMPMRFADTDGSMIDVYQAVTQMTDESGQTFPFTIDTLLDRATGPLGYYGAFTANMHTDSEQSDGADDIVASAQAHDVPVVSAQQLLEWLDGRNSSSFGAVDFSVNHLDFTLTVGSGAHGLRAMVPRTSAQGGTVGSITRNATPVTFAVQTIKGVQYAVFDGVAGAYVVTYPVPGDSDGDGYAPPQDCNEGNPAIHPGAGEACNGIDDDCDSQTDEGCPPTPTPTPTATPVPPTTTRTATATPLPPTSTHTATVTPVPPTATATRTATPGLCGNSNVDPGEQCDDGNTVNGDCCSALCQFEPNGSSCNDFNTCTTGEKCNHTGHCGGFTACNVSLTCDFCGSKCTLNAGTCKCG